MGNWNELTVFNTFFIQKHSTGLHFERFTLNLQEMLQLSLHNSYIFIIDLILGISNFCTYGYDIFSIWFSNCLFLV